MANHEQPPPADWGVILPPWIRATAIVGIPGAIAIFLVWMGANDIPRIARQLETVHAEVLYNRKLLEANDLKADATFRLLQRICSNTAKSNLERQQCFDR